MLQGVQLFLVRSDKDRTLGGKTSEGIETRRREAGATSPANDFMTCEAVNLPSLNEF